MKKRGRGRPRKTKGELKTNQTFRIHPKVLKRIQEVAAESGLGYQTFVHLILEQFLDGHDKLPGGKK